MFEIEEVDPARRAVWEIWTVTEQPEIYVYVIPLYICRLVEKCVGLKEWIPLAELMENMNPVVFEDWEMSVLRDLVLAAAGMKEDELEKRDMKEVKREWLIYGRWPLG